MAGNTASSVLRATPAATRETLSSLSFRHTRRRMSRQPARGISLGVRAARPRPGSSRSAFCGSDCGSDCRSERGSDGRTPSAEQPLFPGAGGAVVAEYQRLLDAGYGDIPLRAGDGRRHEVVMRGELADRIRVRRVAREQISLAAAAAEVTPALRTAAAGLLHPFLATVAAECRRVVPDRADARLE